MRRASERVVVCDSQRPREKQKRLRLHSPIWKIVVEQPTAVHHGASGADAVPRLQAHCRNTWQADADARVTRQQIPDLIKMKNKRMKKNKLSRFIKKKK